MSTDIRHRKQTTEATPLLSPSSAGEGSARPYESEPSTPNGEAGVSWQRRKILCMLFLLLFFIDFPPLTRAAPKLRLMELNLCREYYRKADPSVIAPDGNVPEMLCKLPQIQSELAEIRGVSGMLDGIPGLLLAVPYGIISDDRGRRIVTFLGVLGNILEEIWFYIVLTFYDTFSVKAVYGGSLIMFIGGGSVVLSASVTAMIADVAPESMRTRIFFYANVATFVSELIAPPLGSYMMERFGSRQTYFTTLPWDLITFVIVFVLPETLKMKDPDSANPDSPTRRRSRSAREDEDSMSGSPSRMSRYHSWLREKYSDTKDHIVSDVLPLIERREILLGIAALVVAVFSRPVSEILLQYTSARFHWKLSKAAFLLSYQAALRMLSFSVLFPAAHYWMNRRLRATESTDLTFGIVSSCITVVGLIGMGISTSWIGVILAIIPFTLGGGVAAASKSFVTSQVSREHIGLLYTTCAMFEGVVALIAPAALALALSTGLKLGGLFQGAPFYLVALLYVGAGTCLWFIPANYKRTVFHIDEDDGEDDVNV